MTNSIGQRLAIGSAAILIFIVTLLGALGLVVLAAWPWWVIGAVAVAALLLAVPLFYLRRLFAGEGFSPTRSLASIAVLFFLALSAVVAFPFYFFAFLVDARPSMMPLATLTDGKKVVQFQGMQHIGSEGFYKSVVYDLREALDQGYRLYYEGVQSVEGRKDLDEWFNSLATGGFGDLSGFYQMLADGCGLTFQLNYFKGLTKDIPVHPDRHLVADVSYLDLKTEWDRLMATDPVFVREATAATGSKGRGEDGDAAMIRRLLGIWKTANPEQKRLMGFACRGFFSWSFSQPPASSWKDKLILDFRNKRLVEQIVKDPAQKIWVTYGAHHLTGVIADLEKIDPSWKLVSVKWTPAISNPQERKGLLD